MASSNKCCGVFWGTDICRCHNFAGHLLSSATGLVLDLSRVQILSAFQDVDNEDVSVYDILTLYYQKVLLWSRR